MNELPLVSCIMPTANRHKFIPLALHYFLRQDYLNTELIILDDGQDPVEGLIRADNRIRYLRLPPAGALIGSKRNQACAMAKGSIVMHWDDDDWYAPDWISRQVDVLLSKQADICGLREVFFYNPAANRSWKYVYPANERPWVGGATMAYLKSFWRDHPFPDVQVGEDNQFVWESGGKVATHDYVAGFVSILHSGNTSPKYTNNYRWEQCDPSGITAILKNDAALYRL